MLLNRQTWSESVEPGNTSPSIAIPAGKKNRTPYKFQAILKQSKQINNNITRLSNLHKFHPIVLYNSLDMPPCMLKEKLLP